SPLRRTSSAKSKFGPVRSARLGRADIAAARSAIAQSLHRICRLPSTPARKNNSLAPDSVSALAPYLEPPTLLRSRLLVRALGQFSPSHRRFADPPASLFQMPSLRFADRLAGIVRSRSRSSVSSLLSQPQLVLWALPPSLRSRESTSCP